MIYHSIEPKMLQFEDYIADQYNCSDAKMKPVFYFFHRIARLTYTYILH